jgi:hypothetical protein
MVVILTYVLCPRKKHASHLTSAARLACSFPHALHGTEYRRLVVGIPLARHLTSLSMYTFSLEALETAYVVYPLSNALARDRYYCRGVGSSGDGGVLFSRSKA